MDKYLKKKSETNENLFKSKSILNYLFIIHMIILHIFII